MFKMLEHLHFFNQLEWSGWHERFKRFRLASKLHEATGPIQIHTLIYCVAGKVENYIKQLYFEKRK